MWRRDMIGRERDLDEEVQSWFEIHAARHEAHGMSPEEARREARRGFYGPEQVKPQVREERMGAGIESIARDVRYALRALRRSPGFTAVAVLTLALGIGANTAIFSLVDAVMLRILPVTHPEQLVFLTDPGSSGVATESNEDGTRSLLAYTEFEQLRARSTVFSGLFAAQSAPRAGDVFINSTAHPRRARVQLVSGEFFGVLGIQAAAGRVFGPSEDRVPGANPVGVISWAFWQREFAANASAIGQTMRIGDSTFHIVGIAPAGFHGIEVGADTDVWIPLTMQAQAVPGRDYLTPRDTLWLQAVGRLAPGISRSQAQASVNVTLQQILQDWHVREQLHQNILLQSGAKGASGLRDQFSDPLLVLMAMVGLVLLIACANIANLLLARGKARQREIGVRLALGAARLRLIRQIMTESILIAAMGGALGMLFALLGTRALLAFASASISDLSLDVRSDLPVFLFTGAASLLTGILFGLVPALRQTRVDLKQTLSMNQRGAIGSRLRGGRILVVAQIALSLILVTGATLLAHSLRNMLVQKVGFDRGNLLQIAIDPVSAGYKGASLTGLYRQLFEELRHMSGALDVTLANHGLFSGGDSQDEISLDGSPVHGPDNLRSRWTMVGPNYFSTLGIPLLRGRQMDASDAARGARVCVVNETFARILYPGLDPIGRHVTDEYPTTRETFEIIGVAADAKEHRPDEPRRARFYSTLFHPIGTYQSAVVLVRTAGDPSAVGSATRAAIARVAPNLPITGLITVNEQLGRRLVTQRLIADLSGLFGILGVFMAAIGVYGVMSYSMERRTGEIGIRMALGASRIGVTGMVLKETFRMVVLGAAVGVPCAWAASRLIGSLLFGLKPGDPAALAFALAVILAVCGIAAYVPARRASRVDPMQALRCE